MFETLVTGVLTNVMGNFIDPKCFSSDKISVAVWSGYVVLRDLELKPEVVAHPSVNLVRGVVGSIELKIPWNRLQSESVVLTVDDVYLLVHTEADIEAVLMEMDEFTIKKQLLEQLYAEAKKKQVAEQQDTAHRAKDDGFTARLVNKIIDNIELHIRRIHVRLEDHVTGDHPFAVGLTIESVHAQSTNSNWQPSYVDSSKNSEPRIYKMVELNHLSVYLDPHCEVLRNQRIDFKSCPLEDFCRAFNHSIPKRFDDRHPLQLYPTHQRHHFILKPVDSSARLIVNRDPSDLTIPKFEVDINVAEIGIRLEESQYCDLLYLASAFQVPEHHKKYQQYRKFRPRLSVFDSSATEWWQYAINAIIDDNRKKKLRWSWKYMKERRDDRIRYIQLWMRQIRRLELGPNQSNLLVDSDEETDEDDSGAPTSGALRTDSSNTSMHSRAQVDMTELEAIERKRPIEDIILFRYLADKKLDEDDYTSDSDTSEQQQMPMPPFSDSESVDTEATDSTLPTEKRYRSWGKWMFGWTSRVGVAPSPTDSSVSKRNFPEVELRELFKLVEYEPSKKAKKRRVAELAYPSEQNSLDEGDISDLVSRVTLTLGKGSFTLSSDPETNKRLTRDDPNYGARYAPTDFLLGSFSHLQVAAITKADSTRVDVSLQTIDAFDESADSMAFSRLLTRKQDRAMSSTDDDGGLLSANRMAGPIFLMSYETNPVGVAADAALYVHMEPLEIVFSPTARCWGRLGSFLNTPQVLGLWAELEVASFNDIVNLKARTEAKLHYVMANRVALSVDLRIQAPLVVIPQSDSDYNCSRMVIDLGHINFRTDRLSKLDSETASLSASQTGGFSTGATPSSLVLSTPYNSPQLTSSMSFVRQLYDDAEKGEGAIRWKEEFYDKFTLSVTNVHVILIPHGKAASGQFFKNGLRVPTSSALNGNALPSPDWELVERFNINVTLRTSVLPLDATLTRFYVHADLPALTFNMSLEKYFQLLALVERFGTSARPLDMPSGMKSIQSMSRSFLDRDGTFIKGPGEQFLSSTGMNPDSGDHFNSRKMELHDLIDGDKSGSEELSDAESDDTWFSITSGTVDLPFSGLDETRDQYSLELDTFVLDSGEKNTAAPQSGGARSRLQNSPTRTRERKHGRRGSMTLPSGDLIDRRLFVCSFTVPVIAIQLKKPTPVSVPPSSYRFDHSGIFEDDTPESGTLILKVEGFRVRIAKKTLSTQVDVQIRSLDVEDFVEVGGRSSEYLLFSCPAISAPFDLLAPPRRSFPYAASGGSRRKVSRQRERVISVQNGPGPSLGGSLLELGFGSQCDRQTSYEVSREISVRFGAVHLVCDQSYVCSLLELFEESWYKVSQSSNVTAADDDGDEDFVDAIPLPPDLTSSVTQEFSLPVILTDSVLADLERARNEFIAQEQSVLKSNAPNAAPIALTIGVQLQSVSILFSDRGDAVTSMAIVGTKLRMTRGVQGTTGINIRGAIQDIKLFDLSSARDVSGLGEKDGIPRKPYFEIFGLEQEALASGDKVVELDATINKHFDQSDADAEGTSDAEVMVRSRLAVRVQPVRLQVQSAFAESIANYIIHGSLAARFIAREDIPAGTGLHRRHKRTESLSAEPQRAYHQRVQQHREPDILTPPASTPMQPSPKIPRGGRFSFGLDIVVELLHPSIIIACGQGYSESDEAVVIDLGAITIKAGRDDALDSNRDVSTDGYLVVLVNGALVATRSDHTKVLEETTIRVEVGNEHRSTDEFGRQSLPRRVNIALSPVKLNIGERYLCLALDLWNDVIDPTIQVIDNTMRSPLFSRRKRANADVELATSSPSGWLVVEMAIESLHIVMVSKHNPDFEGWLKTTMEAAEPHLARDAVLGGVTNAGSPRRRRHNFSFAQEETGFRSVTTAPTLVPIAEIVLSNVVGSLDIGGCGSDSSHREQRFAGRLSIHELSIQDLVSDSSEFMSGILTKVPDRNARENPDPQLQVNFSYKLVFLPEDRDPERVISCSVLMSSARLCILPRTLLRIENYAVTVAVSLAQKLAHQDPRIISTIDQQSTALALADPSTGSLGTDLSASQERVVNYGSVRVRKNSLGDSMRESAITSKQKDIEETITCSDGPVTQLRSKFAWTVRAELSEFQIWLLSSDRERDSFGLCLSSRFVVNCEKPVEYDSSKLDASSSKSDKFYVAAKAAGIRVHLGSPTDETMQSYELIEPVTVALNLSAIKHHRPTLDDSADVSLSAIPVNASWDVWRSINSALSVTTVSSRLAYKDLPVILRIVSAVSALSGAEAHVRSPLASIAAHDPYLELSELDTDGDDRSVVDQDKNILSHIPHVVEIAVDVDILKFRLINNLVDEDSPVVGFRVGPLHVSFKDVTDFGTDINGSCSLEAWYHNLRLVASEPLIEPWSFTLTCAQDRAYYKSSVSTRDFEAVSFREVAPWKVTISSAEFFQWNVTDALITNIMAASRAWEWMSRGAAIDSSDRSEYSTYWIRNETGLTLRYWGPACRDNVMSPGAEEPLLFTARSRSKSGEYSFGDSESDQFIGRQLYIAVEDGDECGKFDQEREPRGSVRRWESEFAIPVDQADSRLYALVDLDADLVSSRVRKCECVIDVLVERGIKVFVVRSTLVLENNTASDLEIEYVPPLRRTASPPFRAGAPRGHLIPSWKAVVAASSTLPVPVNLVSATDGYLMVRPPDMKSLTEGSIVQLPKAYAKKRVHLPLFERAITPAVGSTAGEDSPHSLNGEPQCAIKFHRLYGDRPVRPFMMSATLLMASKSLYQRKVAFQPPLVIHNLTAAPLEYCLATPGDWTPATDGVNNPSTSVNLGWEDCQQRLRERGIINVAESLTWHLCDWDTPLELQVRIKGFEWSEPFRIVEDLPEDVYRIRLADLSSSAQLHVSAEAQTVMGRCREISLFVPYWIVNLTGLKLEYEHDDDKASYEHSTMLLAGQKRLDRDELLLKEEQSRANRHSIHSHLVRPIENGEFSNEGVHGSKDPLPRPEIGNTPVEDQPRRHPGLIPSIPPIKGLLDLLPRPIDDSRVVGQLEVLQACHSSSHPERGCVRIRVNELDRRIGSGIGESASKNWTDSIVLDQPGTSGELEATDFSLDRVYSIGYSISTAKGRYSRTKVIMLTPRFMIINTMDASVEVCHSSPRSLPGVDEQGTGSVVSALNPALHLESGGYADFHWSLPFARSKTIRCRLAEPGWSWSGAVPLGEAREYVVRMRNDSTRATRLVRVVLKVDGPCVCVYLREENSSAPPYRIENYSLETFRIHQHSVRRSEILLPHHSLDYAWDEPTQDRVLVVDMLPSAAGDNSRPLRIGSFILDKIYRFPDGLGGTLGIEITADGPTRVLRFTDTRIRAAGGIDASGNASATEAKETKMVRAFPYKYLSHVAFELLVQLQGVGVSIIDNSPRELVYVSFSGLNLEMFVSDGDDDADKSTGAPTSRFAREQHPKVVAMRFQMRDFQIDNQLPVTPYPVLLRFSNPSARTRVIDGKVVNVPVVDVQLVKHDGYAGIDFIRHFNLRVLPLHVRVDGSLLYQLLPVFVHSPVSTGRDPASGVGRGWDVSKFSQATMLLDEYNASLEVGVEILDVMREDGTASVLASSSTITDRDTVHSQHGDHRSMSTITTHANHHGRLVSRAEAKKLYFEEFHVDPIRATVSFSFGVSVGAMVEGLNSWTYAGRNPPATVGPLRLIINAIGTSLAKIANAPFHLKAITIGHSFIQPDALASRLVSHYQSEALRQAYVILGSVDVFGNPMVAWRNLRSGFQDFINEPVHGISKSPTEFALGMGRGTYSLVRASVYTLLDFFARILAASSLGLSEACLKLDEYTGYPATHNIYQGFAQGISGIVVSPIRAVEMSGVRGVIPGVFAGVFGFVLKPVLGVSLAAANTVATLRDAIDPNTKALLMRARPPRHIDVRTRRLKVYSYVESFGEEMVGKLRGGRYRSDGYVGHVDLKQKCFVVTRKRILYVDVKAGQKYEVLWELQADEVVLVEWQPTAEDSKMTLYFIEEDYTPRRRAVLMTKGMFMSKHVVPLPENRVLFVRAMLQQQERSLFVEAINAQAATSILPSQLKQRSLSLDQLSTWQTHFPSEYPMFKLPALAATKSMANVQPLGSTTPSTAEPPTPSSLETKGSFNLGHEITQVVEEDVPGDGDAEDHD